MPEQGERPPLLAVIGQPQVGKKALLSRILGRPATSERATWTIDTRCYTVDVECLVAVPEQAARTCDYEAVVLVFQADQEESFPPCKQWASQAELTQTEIRLCVANQLDRVIGSDQAAADQRQQWTESVREWCSEEMFEYIEVGKAEVPVAVDPNYCLGLKICRSQSPYSRSLQGMLCDVLSSRGSSARLPEPLSVLRMPGDLAQVSAENEGVDERLADRDGEQQGVRRVIAALQAHTWPGLEMKNPTAANSSAAGASGGVAYAFASFALFMVTGLPSFPESRRWWLQESKPSIPLMAQQCLS